MTLEKIRYMIRIVTRYFIDFCRDVPEKAVRENSNYKLLLRNIVKVLVEKNFDCLKKTANCK